MRAVLIGLLLLGGCGGASQPVQKDDAFVIEAPTLSEKASPRDDEKLDRMIAGISEEASAKQRAQKEMQRILAEAQARPPERQASARAYSPPLPVRRGDDGYAELAERRRVDGRLSKLEREVEESRVPDAPGWQSYIK